jgi:hypothetical protein
MAQQTSKPMSDAQMLDAFVTAVDDALVAIDAEDVVELSATEQLATLAVGVVRGFMPVLRDERDRMVAEDRAGQEPEQ